LLGVLLFLSLPIGTRLGGMTCPVGASMRSTTVERGEAGAGAAHSTLTHECDAPLPRIRSARTRAPIAAPRAATRFSAVFCPMIRTQIETARSEP
jgi:hypothetical protein